MRKKKEKVAERESALFLSISSEAASQLPARCATLALSKLYLHTKYQAVILRSSPHMVLFTN